MHHAFAVAGRKQRVVLAVDDEHQVPQVAAAPWRLRATLHMLNTSNRTSSGTKRSDPPADGGSGHQQIKDLPGMQRLCYAAACFNWSVRKRLDEVWFLTNSALYRLASLFSLRFITRMFIKDGRRAGVTAGQQQGALEVRRQRELIMSLSAAACLSGHSGSAGSCSRPRGTGSTADRTWTATLPLFHTRRRAQKKGCYSADIISSDISFHQIREKLQDFRQSIKLLKNRTMWIFRLLSIFRARARNFILMRFLKNN